MGALKNLLYPGLVTVFLTVIPITLPAHERDRDDVLPLSGEAAVSLLTCAPGEAVWAQYGHTAIRVNDPARRIDIAFNYGLFDFNSSHFIWRFTKGETDYMLGACQTEAFLREYRIEDRQVTEQVLNLREEEKQRLWKALCINSLPENRVYRYNFFYDNCATRARIIIERSLDSPVAYVPAGDGHPLRETINRYTASHPWARFGISLLIASPADAPAPFPDQLFAPEAMMEAFSTATVTDSDVSRPLVAETRLLYAPDGHITDGPFPWPHPLIVFWGLFVLVALISISEWRPLFRNGAFHRYRLMDGLVFGVAGLAGLILFFMNFFSLHPATGHNWLLCWLQPLHLIFALLLFLPAFRRSKVAAGYLKVCFFLFLFFLAAWPFLPQYFDPALLPVLLILLSRSLLAILEGKRAGSGQKTRRTKKVSKPHICLLIVPIAMAVPLRMNAQKHVEGKGPRLVIGIFIDRVEAEYLRWFMDGMEEDGLKRLLSEGRLYTDVLYNTQYADNAIVTAGVATGAPPLFHGIIGNVAFNTGNGRIESCVSDLNYMGNYTSSTLAPTRLMVSTVGDELRSGTLNHAKVYSIGMDPEAPILSGGHLANGVFWFDDENGKWCTSTYYNDMPRWLENINDHDADPIPASWTPRYALGKYQYMPHLRNSLFFSHPLKGNDRVRLFKQTPMANTQVLKLARELVNNEHLGQDEYPDMLNLHLNLGDIIDRDDHLSSMEIEDFYFCLDEDLGAFISAIDRQIGQEHVLYYIVGTGEPTYPLSDIRDTPTFSPDRCGVLLNLYLGALYGEGKWVLGHTDRDIYLNRKLMEEKGLSYTDVCHKAAELVSQVEGIRQVTVTQDFIVSGSDSQTNALHNSFCKGRSGDLMLTIETGRNVVWESYPTHNRLIRQAHPSTFVLFFGNGIQSAHLSDRVTVFDIAPTLCRLLYIRPPTACQGTALFNAPQK